MGRGGAALEVGELNSDPNTMQVLESLAVCKSDFSGNVHISNSQELLQQLGRSPESQSCTQTTQTFQAHQELSVSLPRGIVHGLYEADFQILGIFICRVMELTKIILKRQKCIGKGQVLILFFSHDKFLKGILLQTRFSL